jgi:hypothetical protein
MRATSATRASPATGSTALAVVPSTVRLETTKWWSAQAATCGRCVTARTCRSRPSCFINRPTVSATAPPTPASISSKISVAAASVPAATWLVDTAMASAIRDSSPPDATFASGRGVLPACPATRNSADSRPNDWGASCGVSATSKRPPAMPSCCNACVTVFSRRGAALRRAAETRLASS